MRRRLETAVFRGPPPRPCVTMGFFPSATSDRRRDPRGSRPALPRAGDRKASGECQRVRWSAWRLDADGPKKIPGSSEGISFTGRQRCGGIQAKASRSHAIG